MNQPTNHAAKQNKAYPRAVVRRRRGIDDVANQVQILPLRVRAVARERVPLPLPLQHAEIEGEVPAAAALRGGDADGGEAELV